MIIIFIISFIYNNKSYILIFILHYKKSVRWYSDNQIDLKKIQEGNYEWMSHLKDSIDLRELSIPGTHNSAASIFIVPFYKLSWGKFHKSMSSMVN